MAEFCRGNGPLPTNERSSDDLIWSNHGISTSKFKMQMIAEGVLHISKGQYLQYTKIMAQKIGCPN